MKIVTIKSIEELNHNVRRITTSKPDGYEFKPGQATLVAINQEELSEEKRPFTFTSLPDEDELEFVIKIYPSHEGVTDAMDDLKAGDELRIGDAWGAIQYQGPGTFIAGGAGVTPMLAILRDLAQKDRRDEARLIFSNSLEKDLFLKDALSDYTDGKFLLTFSEEAVDGAEKGRIDKAFLAKHVPDLKQKFYVCGPPGMVEAISGALAEMGVAQDDIVTEES